MADFVNLTKKSRELPSRGNVKVPKVCCSYLLSKARYTGTRLLLIYRYCSVHDLLIISLVVTSLKEQNLAPDYVRSPQSAVKLVNILRGACAVRLSTAAYLPGPSVKLR